MKHASRLRCAVTHCLSKFVNSSTSLMHSKLILAAIAGCLCASCAEEPTITEGPRSRAARSSTTTRTVTTEESERVKIPQKPAVSDDNYLRHDR